MPTPYHPTRLHPDDDDDDDANAQMDDLLQEARKYHPESPKVPLRRPAPEQHLPPVVLVEGFFSFFNEVGRFVASLRPSLFPYRLPTNLAET